MIFTHQVMMFKLIITSIKQIHRSVHFTHHFCSGNVYHFRVVTSIAFESKDDPTQMTKIVIYNYILYYIQKTIHSKLICTNVHS